LAFGQISLKGRALKLLAAREHSRKELERKLAQHETEPGQLKTALDELQARGFIDEQRVVESVVHRRASRLGAARIRQELQAKGLDPERITAAVGALRSTEVERARGVWRRRFDAPPADAAQRAKQARFLMARGFSAEIVRKVLAWDDDQDAGT